LEGLYKATQAGADSWAGISPNYGYTEFKYGTGNLVMEIRPITPHLGAEVYDVDLSSSVSDAEFAVLQQAFLDWSVLVFRGQDLDQCQHKSFASRFGELHTHPLHKERSIKDPFVLTVNTDADSNYTAGDGWHTDVTCDAFPPMGSMLYVTEVPEGGGGDTLFANMYLAYDLLSDTLKEMISGLIGIHDGGLSYVGAYKSTPPQGGYPRNEHPVVVTHPETGRKLLYVNAGFTTRIKGLHAEESRALLDFLFRHINSTPKLTARVQWQPGTLTFWDNRCTQHHAVWDYFPHSRYGERVSIVASERPSANPVTSLH
jgi:taurine dioxygenase